MEEAKYQTWWSLHIRVAKGETLNAEEQAVYEAGRTELEAEECLDASFEELRQARQRVMELKAAYERGRARYEAMEAEIAQLESRLNRQEHPLLTVGV